MKKQLYIFNPWHDMALANFTPYYKVSAEILRMSHDLSFLPGVVCTGRCTYTCCGLLHGRNFSFPGCRI